MNKFCTCIGSRQVPIEYKDLMISIGRKLSADSWRLRSGHAAGSDRFFEEGFNSPDSEIYLPWINFGVLKYQNDLGMPIIGKPICDQKQWLKNYTYLQNLGIRKQDKDSVKLLHGRNVAQILGLPNEEPSSFVIFYAQEIEGKVQGGTATAVELAKLKQIPTFNLWKDSERIKLQKWVS